MGMHAVYRNGPSWSYIMIKIMSKKDLKPIVKQLKDGGFAVTNKSGWWKALDDDGTTVMEAMPHSNGSMMLNLNNDYFA